MSFLHNCRLNGGKKQATTQDKKKIKTLQNQTSANPWRGYRLPCCNPEVYPREALFSRCILSHLLGDLRVIATKAVLLTAE